MNETTGKADDMSYRFVLVQCSACGLKKKLKPEEVPGPGKCLPCTECLGVFEEIVHTVVWREESRLLTGGMYSNAVIGQYKDSEQPLFAVVEPNAEGG